MDDLIIGRSSNYGKFIVFTGLDQTNENTDPEYCKVAPSPQFHQFAGRNLADFRFVIAGKMRKALINKIKAGDVNWMYQNQNVSSYVNVIKFREFLKANPTLLDDVGFISFTMEETSADHFYPVEDSIVYHMRDKTVIKHTDGPVKKNWIMSMNDYASFGDADLSTTLEGKVNCNTTFKSGLFRGMIMWVGILDNPMYEEDTTLGSRVAGSPLSPTRFVDGTEAPRDFGGFYINSHPLGLAFIYAGELIYSYVGSAQEDYGNPPTPPNSQITYGVIWTQAAAHRNQVSALLASNGNYARPANGSSWSVKK